MNDIINTPHSSVVAHEVGEPVQGVAVAPHLEVELRAADANRRRLALLVLRDEPALSGPRALVADMAKNDTDPECRALAGRLEAWAAAHEAASKSPALASPWTAAAVGQYLAPLDEAARVAWLRTIAPDDGQSAALVASWRECAPLVSETNVQVLIALGRHLRGRLANADMPRVVGWLDHADHGLASVAMAVVGGIDPGAVRSRLPANLSGPHVERVAGSLAFMGRDDAEEALSWCRALLGDKNATTRYTALAGLSTLPRALSRDLLLRILATDESSLLAALAARELLRQASVGLLKQLCEFDDRARPAAPPVVDGLLTTMGEMLSHTGQLTESLPALTAQTRRLRQETRLAFHRRVLFNVLNSGGDDALQAIGLLSLHTDNKDVVDELAKIARNSTDPRVLTALGKPAQAPVPDVPPLATAIAAARFSTLTLDQQLAVLSNVGGKQAFALVRPELPALLATGSPDPVRCRVLVLLDQYGVDTDAPAILPLLAGSPAPVLALAIAVAARLAPKAAAEHLEKLAEPIDPLPRAALAEALLPVAKARAMTMLAQMVHPGQTRVARALGLAMLARVDYPSAEPHVLSLVAADPDGAVRGQATYWAAMNPSDEGMLLLYRLCHDDNGTARQGLGDIWKTVSEQARQADYEVGALAQHTREIQSRLDRQRQRERTPAPYALRTIAANPVHGLPGESSWIIWARSQPTLAAALLGGAVGLFIFACGMGFLKYSESRLNQMQRDLSAASGVTATATGTGLDGRSATRGSPGANDPARSVIPKIDLSMLDELTASGTRRAGPMASGAVVIDAREELAEAKNLLASGETELALGMLECLVDDPWVATATRQEAAALRKAHAGKVASSSSAPGMASQTTLPVVPPAPGSSAVELR